MPCRDYQELGGLASDFALAQKEGAQKKVQKEMSSCVSQNALQQLAGKEKATAAQLKKFQKTCDSKALQAFVGAGGNAKDYAVAKLEGARSTLSDTLSTCMKDSNATTAASKATHKRSCNDKARSAFGAAGSQSTFETPISIYELAWQ